MSIHTGIATTTTMIIITDILTNITNITNIIRIIRNPLTVRFPKSNA